MQITVPKVLSMVPGSSPMAILKTKGTVFASVDQPTMEVKVLGHLT